MDRRTDVIAVAHTALSALCMATPTARSAVGLNTDPEVLRVEMWKSLTVRVRGQLQELDDVIHVIQVADGVVDGTDDLHGVTLQHFTGAQFGGRRYVFK